MDTANTAEHDDIAQEFIARHGDDCSYILVRWWQVAWYVGVVVALICGLAYRWDIVLCVLNTILALWYFSIVLFRTLVVGTSLAGMGQVKVKPDELEQIKDEDLPMYTILVPLYKEANIADRIVKNLGQLDYPVEKLDIKLLLESDDTDTIQAVENSKLESHYDVIVVPDSLPKTKPKACNYGLKRAKGELCVIYDAEDRPDPDQLKKVAIAFRSLPNKIACVQAKLNYYNANQNILTKWFTIEYSTTFDLYLPGLQSAGIPVPLGGTSNHFRTHVLRELEGWDPFNVTEDCDLGVRLYRLGYKTMMIDSTTWEEANSNLWNWVRQRSRWVKGFFQTHLTHTRNPFKTLRQLGPWGYVGFVLCVGGSSFMMVLNVFYWIIGAIYLGLLTQAALHGHTVWEVLKGPRDWFPDSLAWPMIYYGPLEDPLWSSLSIVFFVVTCALLAANLLFVFMHCLACLKRRYYSLLPYALLMPIYWVLISIGAWKGFIQLFTNPFYWEKTIHGLNEESKDS